MSCVFRREYLSLRYLYFYCEFKHAINLKPEINKTNKGKTKQLASILKTQHKWPGLWNGLLAATNKACRDAQIIGLGIAVESEESIWWRVGGRRSGFISVLMCGGQPWNGGERTALLSDQSNFQTSIILQVKWIYQFIQRLVEPLFPHFFFKPLCYGHLHQSEYTQSFVRSFKLWGSQLRLKPRLVHTVKTDSW